MGHYEAPSVALERLDEIAREMRDRKVNHGKAHSPTLIAWANRITAELATLRAGLSQQGECVAAKVGPYRVTVAENAVTISEGRKIVFTYDADAPPINTLPLLLQVAELEKDRDGWKRAYDCDVTRLNAKLAAQGAEIERLTRENETMRNTDYHQAGVEQEAELIAAERTLEEACRMITELRDYVVNERDAQVLPRKAASYQRELDSIDAFLANMKKE